MFYQWLEELITENWPPQKEPLETDEETEQALAAAEQEYGLEGV